jgi:hypothetical protein
MAPDKDKNHARFAICVVNNALKEAFAELLRSHAPVLEDHYTHFVATQGTARILHSHLPTAQIKVLPHGPDHGDHYVVHEALALTKAGQAVHIYGFFDSNVEPHEWAKQNVQKSAMKSNWCWFPTPATAREFLEKIRAINECKATETETVLSTFGQPPSAKDITHPTMSEYLKEKYYHMRTDKLTICRYIATDLIQDKQGFILDSGTTIADIPLILSYRKRGVRMFTNNLIAVIPIVGSGLRCTLLGGESDQEYGASYHETKGETLSWLRPIQCDWTILAAVRITYSDGPLVRAGDKKNQVWKESLIHKCLAEKSNRLVIAVDWTKFMLELTESYRQVWEPVLANKEDWQEVLGRNDFFLVTQSPNNDDPLDPRRERARAIIRKFQVNDRQGMQVVCLSPGRGVGSVAGCARIN